MRPTFSPCCGSPDITDTGSTLTVLLDECDCDVLVPATASVFRCGPCGNAFAALLEECVELTDADFVYGRIA
jgi:hypothetical protein